MSSRISFEINSRFLVGFLFSFIKGTHNYRRGTWTRRIVKTSLYVAGVLNNLRIGSVELPPLTTVASCCIFYTPLPFTIPLSWRSPSSLVVIFILNRHIHLSILYLLFKMTKLLLAMSFSSLYPALNTTFILWLRAIITLKIQVRNTCNSLLILLLYCTMVLPPF